MGKASAVTHASKGHQKDKVIPYPGKAWADLGSTAQFRDCYSSLGQDTSYLEQTQSGVHKPGDALGFLGEDQKHLTAVADDLARKR